MPRDLGTSLVNQFGRRQKWLPFFLKFLAEMRIDSKEVEAEDDRGSKLNLWGSQRRFLENLCEGLTNGIHEFYYLKARQAGITTIGLGIVLFWVAAHPRTIGCIVADTPENSQGFRDTIIKMANSFPRGFVGTAFRVTKNNKDFISFSNGSRLDLLVAGKRKDNWAESRGYTLGWLSEVSKYGSQAGIDSFKETMSQTNPNRLFIFESTANGPNHWQAMWKEAGEDTITKSRCFIGWWAKELNTISQSSQLFSIHGVNPPNKEERELIQAVANVYGHLVTQDQLAWWRWKAADTAADMSSLHQNNPWCVVSDTRVGTNRGILRIEDVEVGDVTSRGRVTHSGPTGTARIWRATTSLGYEIRGTANHPIVDAFDDEVALSECQGDTIRLQAPKFADEIYVERWRDGVIEHSVTITPDFARLVGLYMGDGSLTGQGGTKSGYQFAISCTAEDEDVVAECKRLIKDLFGLDSQERNVIGGQNRRKTKGCTHVRVTSRLIAETFNVLGLTYRRPDGGVIRHVHIPEFIWRSPKDVVKEFLSGLFEADGFNAYNQNRVQLCAKDTDFIRGIQKLLLGFEITCRLSTAQVRLGGNNEHLYTTNYLELRSEEAKRFNERIGFISYRKRSRGNWEPRFPNWKTRRAKAALNMMDDVVSVIDEGVDEEVYNLTIEGDHIFDCNGILTHNTAEQAFVLSGYSFFQNRIISKKIDDLHNAHVQFKGYRFFLGNDFFQITMEQITELERLSEVELRVWEEPLNEAQYVIGCDPAYGRTEFADRHAISVWRCYGDKLVQVAEYADHRVETYQAAWVLAYLAGAYRDCLINLELGGPGRAVLQEFNNLRQRLRADVNLAYIRDLEWEDFLGNARWYLYHRPDSMGSGYALSFETTWRTKMELMNQFRDNFTTDTLIIHSMPLLREMTSMIQERNDIAPAAPGLNKDDRVFAAALANRAWIEWVQQPMLANGATFETVSARERGEETSSTQLINRVVYDFFRKAEERAQNPERPSWMVDRGFI